MYNLRLPKWRLLTTTIKFRGEAGFRRAFRKVLCMLIGADLVLDVGCGIGVATKEMAKISAEVIGTDLSKRDIIEAKERNPMLDFIICDAETFPFRDSVFDAVVFIDVLHHLMNPKVAIDCAGAISRGKVLILDINRSESLVKRCLEEIYWFVFDAGRRYFDKHDWRELVGEAHYQFLGYRVVICKEIVLE